MCYDYSTSMYYGHSICVRSYKAHVPHKSGRGVWGEAARESRVSWATGSLMLRVHNRFLSPRSLHPIPFRLVQQVLCEGPLDSKTLAECWLAGLLTGTWIRYQFNISDHQADFMCDFQATKQSSMLSSFQTTRSLGFSSS